MSELSGHLIPVVMRISLESKLTIQISQILNIMHKGNVFSAKPLEKAYFIVKMSGPAMVQPVSSDFWRAP